MKNLILCLFFSCAIYIPIYNNFEYVESIPEVLKSLELPQNSRFSEFINTDLRATFKGPAKFKEFEFPSKKEINLYFTSSGQFLGLYSEHAYFIYKGVEYKSGKWCFENGILILAINNYKPTCIPYKAEYYYKIPSQFDFLKLPARTWYSSSLQAGDLIVKKHYHMFHLLYEYRYKGINFPKGTFLYLNDDFEIMMIHLHKGLLWNGTAVNGGLYCVNKDGTIEPKQTFGFLKMKECQLF